jgi:thiamine pyrophosphate-dependent acetolactate synthase large subunit-like protein
MGTMGYSIPAAMGAKYQCPEKEVVAVCGDGSFQMSMMELATMRQHGIRSKVIVLRNNYLGMVRQYQHFTYEDHYSVVDLTGSPDLSKIAAAYDMPYYLVEKNKGLPFAEQYAPARAFAFLCGIALRREFRPHRIVKRTRVGGRLYAV